MRSDFKEPDREPYDNSKQEHAGAEHFQVQSLPAFKHGIDDLR
jgi:hypothetical protein